MIDGKRETNPGRNDDETDDLDAARHRADGIELTFDERDLDSELDDGRAGQRGTLVEAICTGCRLTRAKRASEIDREDPDLSVSFKHVCHECQTATWWNPLRLLEDAARRDQE